MELIFLDNPKTGAVDAHEIECIAVERCLHRGYSVAESDNEDLAGEYDTRWEAYSDFNGEARRHIAFKPCTIDLPNGNWPAPEFVIKPKRKYTRRVAGEAEKPAPVEACPTCHAGLEEACKATSGKATTDHAARTIPFKPAKPKAKKA